MAAISDGLNISFWVPYRLHRRFEEAAPGHGERSKVMRLLLTKWLNGEIDLTESHKPKGVKEHANVQVLPMRS